MTIRPSQLSIKKPLEDLRRRIENGMVKCGIPGLSVAVLHKGEIIFAEGFGKRNEQDPFTAETLSPIGSLTKAFTATAIGELVAEGKLDWDKTPVSEYLPEFQLKDPVLTSQLTMDDLLSHRTGVPRLDREWAYRKEPRLELIKCLRHVDAPPKLGSAVLYNNMMYAVAGEAAATVAGMPYEKLVEEKVIGPLKLSNTGFSPMEMKKRPNHAMPFTANSLEDAQNGLFHMHPLDEVYMQDSPAGDMYSNVFDMVHWGKVVMAEGKVGDEQTLNKDSVRRTLTATSIMDASDQRRSPDFGAVVTYGLGWGLDSYKGHVHYRHSGAISGFQSKLKVFPDDDLVIAHLYNVEYATFDASYDIVDELLGLPKTEDWILDWSFNITKRDYEEFAKEIVGDLPKRVPNTDSLHDLEAFEGEYFSPIQGAAIVSLFRNEETGEMTLRFSLGLWPVHELEHYHYDIFLVRLMERGVELKELAVFKTEANGAVDGFVLSGNEFKRVHSF
ncbi:hypothetical protein BGZ70_000643 [Mortierella alpina]|uniref:Beta-lactamase-related domain-containing protein n=1 Tax=Mortierella alpina TaxID=64518 RepID=A0A9P6JEF8_MORAP|nr:hypothetical protein BGZ70_000643 [Mortierella alpina]